MLFQFQILVGYPWQQGVDLIIIGKMVQTSDIIKGYWDEINQL